MISFKEWLELQEVITSTSDIATYSRRSLPQVDDEDDDVIRRSWVDEDPFFRRKRHKKHRGRKTHDD